MTIDVSIFSAPGGNEIKNITPRARDVTIRTNTRGFESLTCFVPMTMQEAFRIYDRAGLPHVVASSHGGVVWEGRLEDVAITGDGIRLTAYGYQRALSDAPYTALWSKDTTADFKPISRLDVAARTDAFPERFSMNLDTNHIYISNVKNNTYGNTAPTEVGYYVFSIPDSSGRQIVAIDFDWELIGIDANWNASFRTLDSTYTTVATPWTQASNAGTQTGTQNLSSLTAADRCAFMLYRSAADAAVASETGAISLRITNLRIKTTSTATVLASEIASALVSFVNTTNSTQLSSATGWIQSPGVDLKNELYLHQNPSDILTYLANIGNSATPPIRYEWSVWEDRVLRFVPRSTYNRSWYVDASEVTIERTLDSLRNSAYGVYRTADGTEARTSTSSNTFSIARYAVTRRAAVSVNTASSTQAGIYRDAFLEDNKVPRPRVGLRFDELYDASGGRFPLWACRGGDTITIRNLPPSLSISIDRIRTFRVSETEYSLDNNILTVVPEDNPPTLDFLVARNAAGVSQAENSGFILQRKSGIV